MRRRVSFRTDLTRPGIPAAYPRPDPEEPEYQIVRKLKGIEVREYAAYTVAELLVPGPASDAGGQAFPILAGYIFGKNKGDRRVHATQ